MTRRAFRPFPLGAATALAASLLLTPNVRGQSAAAAPPPPADAVPRQLQAADTPQQLQAADAPRPPLAAEAKPQPRPLGAGAPVIATRLLPGERIRIDGRLDHPAWQRAPAHADFVQKFPETGAKPGHETQVRVLYDDEALYVGIEALDPDPGRIRAPLVRHDMVNRTQDFIAVYVDPVGTRQSAQFFRVNAAGSTADGIQTAADDNEDFAPDFDFDAAAHRHGRGYSVVLRIPFASLRFGSEASPAWRIMVARRVPREQFHLHTSVLIPVEAPSFIATMQPLQGVQLPAHQQFLTLRPSLTWRTQRERPFAGPPQRSSSLDPTLDLKWRPLPELVIDATLNPDFSQVALDVPQLSGNTRFALSVSEKRPFFFESSDLLRSPTDAIYTRSFTEPRWGLRGTWRGRSVAGSAFAIDDRGGGLVLLPGPYSNGYAAQPASRAVVARGLAGGEGLQWGGLVVARRYEHEAGANDVAGPDLSWQVNDAWRMRGQWLASDTTAHPDADGRLRRGASVSGHRGLLRVTRLTDETELNVTLDDSSTGFRQDSGFVPQNGVRTLNVTAGKVWRPLGPLNEFWLNLRFDDTRDKALGQSVTRDLWPGFWLAGPHNLEADLYFHRSQLRTQATGPLHEERYWKGFFVFTPARWMPFFEVRARHGHVVDVEADRLRKGGDATVIVTMRPHARFELEPQASYAWYDGEHGGWAYRETTAQLLAVWHFDARQTLRAIVQRSTRDRQAEPTLAAYRAADTAGSLTYAFRQSSGTVLYAGASRSRAGADRPDRGTEFFIKLQVDVDELRRRF